MDLRGWDFARQGAVRLDGEWEFHWDVLPDAAGRLAFNGAPAYFVIPGKWDGLEWGGKLLPAQGHATFRLRVRLGARVDGLAVRISHALSAYALWVDGRPVAGNGVVGTEASGSRPEMRPAVFALPSLGPESERVLAVSNHHHGHGGPWRAIELALEPDLRASREQTLIFEQAVTGALVLSGLFCLALFSRRPADRAPLYFGLFCLAMAVRQFSTGEVAILRVVPGLSWGALLRLQLLPWFAILPLLLMFLRALYPAEFHRWAEWAALAAGAAFTLLLFATPLALGTGRVLGILELLTVLWAGYCVFGTARAARHGREGAGWLLAGLVVLAAVVAHDLLFHRLLFGTRYLAPLLLPPLLLPPLLLAQTLLLAGRFARAFATAESLQRNLELKVAERTRELAGKNAELEGAIAELRSTQRQLQQVGLPVRSGPDVRVIPYSDILCLSTRGGKTVVHTPQGEQEVARPLKEVETQLAPEVFQRIHRQCIVNLRHVAEVVHIGNGAYAAVLRGKNDATLPVSRYLAAELKERLGALSA